MARRRAREPLWVLGEKEAPAFASYLCSHSTLSRKDIDAGKCSGASQRHSSPANYLIVFTGSVLLSQRRLKLRVGDGARTASYRQPCRRPYTPPYELGTR